MYYIFCLQDIYAKAGMAQLVARHIGNVEVTGSIPVASLLIFHDYVEIFYHFSIVFF